MVSTRGVRYKFSEGERVLCYEPDPTKAKVLYDSKVLEVIESRDKRGRRTVEYLIHFQGWNSSWDRCVSEDFVLKDTEENRQLQRDLAEKSQLQLGAYLYRRERKKGTTASAGAPAKRARHGFSDDGSSSSTQPDEVETAGDTDSSMCSGSSSQPPASPPYHLGRAQINLPPQLRDSLTFDYHLIMKRGRLSRLPASPTAAEVLEMFVRWFARSGAWASPRSQHKDQHKPNMLDVCCRLNLVREVADGIRVYFDFILQEHLLYKQEQKQYHEYCGQYEQSVNNIEIKVELETTSDSVEETTMRSPKTPEYSHLPPDPDIVIKTEVIEPVPLPEKVDVNGKSTNEKTEDTTIVKKETRCATRSGTLARRLRSHKSVVSPEAEESSTSATVTTASATATSATATTSYTTNDKTPEVPAPGSSAGSSESLASGVRPAPSTTSGPAPPVRTPLSLLLEKVAKWQIIPREGTEHLPCRVYGAIHLARLFVKLPDFLNATQMPDMKLKLILKYLDMFIQYLEEHNEWFGESNYLPSTRSH